VVQLLQTGGGSDTVVELAWDRIGQYYHEKRKWRKAVQFFTQVRPLR